eukprot:COSAG01_NODE_538_length_15761_cov_8.160388_2_plen_143_part_00
MLYLCICALAAGMLTRRCCCGGPRRRWLLAQHRPAATDAGADPPLPPDAVASTPSYQAAVDTFLRSYGSLLPARVPVPNQDAMHTQRRVATVDTALATMPPRDCSLALIRVRVKIMGWIIKNWLRFPYESTFLRSHSFHPPP